MSVDFTGDAQFQQTISEIIDDPIIVFYESILSSQLGSQGESAIKRLAENCGISQKDATRIMAGYRTFVGTKWYPTVWKLYVSSNPEPGNI